MTANRIGASWYERDFEWSSDANAMFYAATNGKAWSTSDPSIVVTVTAGDSRTNVEFNLMAAMGRRVAT